MKSNNRVCLRLALQPSVVVVKSRFDVTAVATFTTTVASWFHSL